MATADQRFHTTYAPARPVEVPAVHGAEMPVRLRRLEQSDRAAYAAMLARSRETVSRWLPLNEPGETDDALFDRQLALAEDGDRTRGSWRRVGTLPDGMLCGVFCLNSISRGMSWEADAVWWIDAALRRRGLATAGVRAMLTHAFGDMPVGLGLHSVHCGIEQGNGTSVRVAERCGFVHKPEKRSHLKVGNRWAMHEFYLATPELFAAATGS